ncbi:MAG TPA: hypothetical protein VKL61_11260 [Candidatus Polarisedimenticolia bacterium]|nr:hypothetical protein [Candidatus Polarisedimenticolia bacterium]
MMIRLSHADCDYPNLDPSHPEPALPQKLFRRLRSQTAGQGELRLALAVLEDAVHCIERNQGAEGFVSRLLLWEAKQWIESEDHKPLFSFEAICLILGLDAHEIREQIHLWCQHPRRTAMTTVETSRYPVSRAHSGSDLAPNMALLRVTAPMRPIQTRNPAAAQAMAVSTLTRASLPVRTRDKARIRRKVRA